MPNPTPRRVPQAYSMRHAQSVSSFSDPRTIALLADNLVRDYYTRVDNWDDISVANHPFWTAANTGAGAASPALSTTLGLDSVLFTTGGGNPGVSTLYGTTATHQSADNPVLYLRYRQPAAVTAFRFEIGWTNVVTTKTTQCVSALTAAAVPTVGNGLTDGVVFCMDTTFTLATPALVGIGTSTAAAGVKAVSPRTTTAISLTAAKWVDLYIGAYVGGGYVEMYQDDALLCRHTVESGPDTAKAMFPFISFGDSGTSKLVYMVSTKIVRERNTR